MSEDPIRWEGGMNFYGYVRNNPVRFVDPFGLTFNIPFVNGKFEKAIRKQAEENGLSLSKKGSQEIRKETTGDELGQFRNKNTTDAEKLELLVDITDRVINNERVDQEIRDELSRLKDGVAKLTEPGACP